VAIRFVGGALVEPSARNGDNGSPSSGAPTDHRPRSHPAPYPLRRRRRIEHRARTGL